MPLQTNTNRHKSNIKQNQIMKTVFKVIAAAAVLTLATTTSFAQKGPRGQLMVGAARVDVTPDEKDL